MIWRDVWAQAWSIWICEVNRGFVIFLGGLCCVAAFGVWRKKYNVHSEGTDKRCFWLLKHLQVRCSVRMLMEILGFQFHLWSLQFPGGSWTSLSAKRCLDDLRRFGLFECFFKKGSWMYEKFLWMRKRKTNPVPELATLSGTWVGGALCSVSESYWGLAIKVVIIMWNLYLVPEGSGLERMWDKLIWNVSLRSSKEERWLK